MKLQITNEISNVKGFHMKLQVKFHMWKDKVIRSSFSHEITNYKVKFYIYTWKDFTWNYKLQWNFECERILHEIRSKISLVKGFHMKLKLQVKFHMRKDFIWSKKVKFHMWKISHEVKSEISYVRGIHIKLQTKFHMWWNFTC
jgi:hypothetical protein